MFALADGNNFYASCERVFNPTVRNRPVIVLSNNDGCIIARSNESKALGIGMGQPVHEVKELVKLHNIAVFSSNYTLYGDMSRRMMEVLETFAPEVEAYSIDEAFLNLNGIPGDMEAYGHRIRNTVYQWTGLPVGLGISHTKTLAKVANKLSKKANGVCVLDTEEKINLALGKLAVGDIWGIGRRWAAFLQSHGINTALDFRNAKDGWIRKHMNVVALRTVQELRGIPCIAFEEVPEPKKGITVSRSFGKTLTRFEDVREALATFTTRAGEKLRGENLMARHMLVFIRNNPFSKKEPYYHREIHFKLPYPTHYTPELTHWAAEGLKQIFKPGFAYKKCGIWLTDLSPADTMPRGILSDKRDLVKQESLMLAVDKLNQQWGRNTVGFAGQGIASSWKQNRTSISPCFTTRFSDLLTVRA